MGTLLKRGTLVLILIVIGAMLWRATRPRPADVFVEGTYLEPIHSYGGYLELRSGRVRRVGVSDILPAAVIDEGRYERQGSRITITYDDPKGLMREKVDVLYYRSVGHVPVLLTEKALATLDEIKMLSDYHPGEFYYVYMSDLGGSDRTRWVGRLRNNPEFAAAFPEEIQRYSGYSWWLYQRMRLRDLQFEHPKLYNAMPEWLQLRLMRL